MKYAFIFLLGIGVGWLLFLILPYIPLSVNSPILSAVGINKPRIVAFLPYYLASRATNYYDSEITTLTYFSLTINNDGHVVKSDGAQQEDPGWYDLQTSAWQKRFQDAQNNHITLSLAVSQSDEASIEALMSDPTKHAQNLLGGVIPVMKQYGFSDLNIDIESFKDVNAAKQKQFFVFLTTLKEGLAQQHMGTLTVDIAPIAFVKEYLTNPIQVGEAADYVFVMAYDYNTVVSPNTGPIAPIGGVGKEREYDVSTTIAIANKEINPQKIIFGLPLYGYEWDSLSNMPGAATIPDTGETESNRRMMATFVASCKTCRIISDPLAQESDYISQDKAGDPYFNQAFLFNTNDFGKRITFAQQNNLAGVGLWALGYEGNTLLDPLTSYKQTPSFQ